MDALAGTLIGGLLALIGGYFVRRQENRRAARAAILLDHVIPTVREFGELCERLAEREGGFPKASELMAERLGAASAAAGPRDYTLGEAVVFRAHLLREDFVRLGPDVQWVDLSDEQVRHLTDRAFDVADSAEQYQFFLEVRLGRGWPRRARGWIRDRSRTVRRRVRAMRRSQS